MDECVIGVAELVGCWRALNSCIYTSIFGRSATLEEIPAKVQVNLKHEQEMWLMDENNCTFASIRSNWGDMDENNCTFAVI